MRLMEIDEQKDLTPADPPAAEVSKRDRLKARLKEKYPDAIWTMTKSSLVV